MVQVMGLRVAAGDAALPCGVRFPRVATRTPAPGDRSVRSARDFTVATLGPVSEPYTIGFPKPAEFFGFLVTGEYTLVECYSKTVLLTSWMTVLVGDPLYNPYRGQALLRVEQVQPSPAGSKYGFAK